MKYYLEELRKLKELKNMTFAQEARMCQLEDYINHLRVTHNKSIPNGR